MTSSTARVAVQLEPDQLEEMQRAARLLLAHPLITASWPGSGSLIAVRRWETVLRAEFDRVLGYRLEVGRTCARLYRRPATLVATRGPRTRTDRPLGPLACSFLCLALAAAEGLGEQTTASQIAEEVQRLRAGDEGLLVDFTLYDQRRAFVDALGWLEVRGVLVLRDGEADAWLSSDGEGDALYDLDRDIVSRLLVNAPSVLRDVDTVEDFLREPLGPSDEAHIRRLRHQIGRRIVGEPVVSLVDLDEDQLAHLRRRRGRIVRDLEQLTGCIVEVRAEGVALIDDGDLSAEPFPGSGTETQAALLWGAELSRASTSAPVGADGSSNDAAPNPWRPVAITEADAAWGRVVAGYRARFKTEYRDDPSRLRPVVERSLQRFGLLAVDPDGSLRCHAALDRYRPEDAGQEQAITSEPDLWSEVST